VLGHTQTKTGGTEVRCQKKNSDKVKGRKRDPRMKRNGGPYWEKKQERNHRLGGGEKKAGGKNPNQKSGDDEKGGWVQRGGWARQTKENDYGFKHGGTMKKQKKLDKRKGVEQRKAV